MSGRTQIIDELSAKIRQLERPSFRRVTDVLRLPTGFREFGKLLPEPGWPRGCLVEWLSVGVGTGISTLALLATRQPANDDLMVLIDGPGDFFPPAATLMLNLDRTVVVRPQNSADLFWTLEQSLRTKGVGTVLCAVDRMPTQAFRKLQLAAETGGSLGVLLRPEKTRGHPSFAEYRFLVEPQPIPESQGAGQPRRRWQVELLRARRQFSGGRVMVELDDEPSGHLRVVSHVASATAEVRAAGA